MTSPIHALEGPNKFLPFSDLALGLLKSPHVLLKHHRDQGGGKHTVTQRRGGATVAGFGGNPLSAAVSAVWSALQAVYAAGTSLLSCTVAFATVA